MSASIATGVPVPMTQPQNRGWMLPVGYGSTSRLNSSYTSRASVGLRGAGVPDSRLRTSAGTGRHTGGSRTVRRYSSISSTMRWPSWRSSSHPRVSTGARLISGEDLVVGDAGFELDGEVGVLRGGVGFLI